MTAPPIVLASGSPRRHELLASLGVQFDVVIPDIDEAVVDGEAAANYVTRLAIAKAGVVERPGSLVIAADTTVELHDEIIGKPFDRVEAQTMLRRLSGRTHRVHTGVAVAWGGRIASAIATTEVTFVDLTDADIAWYAATGEPDDKAGAYGMQGTGNVFVASISGSPSNVIGLPLATVVALARDLGVDLLRGP